MRIRLYVVHGSHPCAAVEKALTLKGLPYRVWEWPPAMHAPMQRMLFGRRTVPGIRIDGERIVGSRAIMHRLDELAPEPALYPGDPRIEEADRWGDETFQPVARELVWAGLSARPDAMVSFGEHSKLPLPAPAVRMSAGAITFFERKLNRTNAEVARRALAGLPEKLDHVDALIADGVIGDATRPNAADLQIASTVRLLLTVGDARALIEGRPCAVLARELFPVQDGEIPAGVLAG